MKYLLLLGMVVTGFIVFVSSTSFLYNAIRLRALLAIVGGFGVTLWWTRWTSVKWTAKYWPEK